MVTDLSQNNSLLSCWMSEVRNIDVQNDRMRFRKNIERIGEVAAYHISQQLNYKEVTVQTPMGEASCMELAEQPILATILRAGLPLHQGLLNFFDKADNAFIAAYRKHHKDGSFEIDQQYVTCPDLDGKVLIISDPMLATGASLVLALQTLTDEYTPASIHIVSVIGCTVGIEYVKRKFPNVNIWVGSIDDELTAKGYIVPGLGDAGDLCFGEKLQS